MNEKTIKDSLQTFYSLMTEHTRDEVLISLEFIKANLNRNQSCNELSLVNSTAIELSRTLGIVLEWEKWEPKIPFIQFDPDMCVKILPPHMGVMIRFIVSRKGHTSGISVYLDCHKVLGISPPYWEVYPVDGDYIRVDINDVDGLLEKIRIGLNETVEGD